MKSNTSGRVRSIFVHLVMTRKQKAAYRKYNRKQTDILFFHIHFFYKLHIYSVIHY